MRLHAALTGKYLRNSKRFPNFTFNSSFNTFTGISKLSTMVVPSNLDVLKRWSCLGKDQKSLPGKLQNPCACISRDLVLTWRNAAVSQIKAIHIYDFDNTLFLSPTPNPKLWTQYTVGLLQTENTFVNGGWWHDNRLLEATGMGMQKEETRAWQGWWNEDIVKLVELSLRQADALTVLLTGRSEKNFTNVIKRMIKSKRLDFDLVCLKSSSSDYGRPVQTTMGFKQALIKDLIANCQGVEEVKIYEDRPKQ